MMPESGVMTSPILTKDKQMSKTNGYILLFRSICSHWLWDDKPFSKGQAWMDLVMMVNHDESKIPFDNGIIKINRGETLTSHEKLSKRWGWSRKKTANFINCLKRDDMLHVKRTGKGTILTVVNYDNFQSQGTKMERKKGDKESESGTGKEHKQIRINKDKRKKENNTPLRGKYFDDPNEFLNDTKYLDDYLECESFAHEDVERAVLIRRMELGLDDPNDENVKKRRKELGLDG